MAEKIRPQKVWVHPDFRSMLYEMKAQDPHNTLVDLTKIISDHRDMFKEEMGARKRSRGSPWKL